MNISKLSKVLILVAAFSISIISCSSKSKETPQVKNVILLIGDGMGSTQVYAAMSVANKKLNLERSQYFGYSKTYSANNYTTDSGAGGTAISSGTKTKNYSVGVDTNGKPVKTILEYANEQNLSTGLVSTCNLAHATPASFIAHQTSRGMYPELAKDFLNTRADVLIGGGKVLFDTNNVTSQMIENGYEVAYDLDSIKSGSEKPLACFVADDHPKRILDGRGDMLPKATQLALNRLITNKNGFFLMVEGSQIDWGGHSNDIDYITSELIDFDQAVGVAFDFADSHPGTLVIVTADHETGGLTLPSGNIAGNSIQASFSTGSHTGVMVPVFAYGARAESFSSIMENIDIFYKMMEALQLSK